GWTCRSPPATEALLDLDLVERRLLQIAERGIARAEIVERQADAEGFEARKGLVGGIALGEENDIGDLKLEAGGAEAGLLEVARYGRDNPRVVELDRGQ